MTVFTNKMVCTHFINDEHIRIDTNVCRFNAMATPDEKEFMKSEHVPQEVKDKIQKQINDLIKKFLCAQFSTGSGTVPKHLEKADTYLFITSIEDRITELKKLKDKTKNHSILTDESYCGKFRLELSQAGDKGAEPVKASQQCTPT